MSRSRAWSAAGLWHCARVVRPLALCLALLAAQAASAGAHDTVVAKPEKAAVAALDAPGDATATPRRQRELRAEQRELKARLAQLKKALATAESAHAEAADALAVSESAISTVNRHLIHLAALRHHVEQRIGELQAAGREAAVAQDAHATRLGQALREQFLLAQPVDLLALVDPEQSWRDLGATAYLDDIVRERLRRIGQLQDRQTELAARQTESEQRRAELEKIAADERASRTQLLKQELARRATLARLARDITQQRESVAKLERDDARLARVIDQITSLLAEQARRRAQARPKGEEGRAGTTEGTDRAARAEDFVPPASTQFDKLRGHLSLPVQGQIDAHYGAARLGEDGKPQLGAPAWKGLFIRAEAGSPVHAVAAGRVVFADWLRGFGNLLILDHGEGFLSVYAYNESLLHGVGDAVTAGEPIAAVGNTGGNARSGLYFEMRFQGRPFDPLSWTLTR